ncbi:Non-ribosomal peptide synthetase module [Basidiobolus meristosporus CBS 931.73]|uniref:Non-ribosomal peptide synthetase module n=1 Tax=Basidiobolus meristosporus CBS 931.73 TaxID=1314790 RepID=A0A1Y1YIT4_9FUNG|nr:Non-ribosomal peptide synthetase module [Basidiobolus meristosporus CBS 931.73]|eukprot:ORX97912.1 Non-ribosomal peptide synthetase module [Basidiobolus meristosporus CBS 931.73]
MPDDIQGENTQRGYWYETLKDAPVLLDLPTDRPRPPHPSFAGATSTVQFDTQTTHSLKLLSQENDTTQFIILLIAWSAVLSRLSGQEDLVIGIPRAQQGCWLPLRIDLSSDPSTIKLAKLVQACVQEAQMNSAVPNEQILEIVSPPEKLNHAPLFQVTLAASAEHTPDMVSSAFDLELNLHNVDNEIHGYLRFATSLFDSPTIERYIGYLKMMLQGMMADPTRSVHKVNIITPAERTLLTETWNQTHMTYAKHTCIHQLFEQQVMRTPNATALVYEGQVWSYEEVNERANRLAHQLVSLGVKPDMRIAICVERSPAMVVGLLAILKAGGAFVPLDPAYPSNRLVYILNDAAPVVLIADGVGRSVLSSESLASLTILDPNMETTWPCTNPTIVGLASHHLAYVIYTSGSTGNPKGVMVEHRGVTNLIQAERSCFGADSSSRVLQFASLSFDTSVSEIFMALSCGGSLYLPPDIARFDRNALWSYLAHHAISHVTLTPTMLQDGQNLPILNTPLTLIMGGEALSGALLQTLIPQGVVINAYGPTEASISAIIWRCPPDFKGEVVPIGRPIANTRVYLLDKYGQPVPLGAVGEIYIGGAGVTRGYLNRPDMTAERFLPDPFSNDDDGRMYKTGDLARYLQDGTIVYLGRNDQQVKMHGIRIEVGEIEARLVEHPQVREAVVLVLGEGSSKRLVAYVMADPDEYLGRTLRVYLKSKMPEYMIPTNFVRLDALPLSPNDKLDRRALPTPDEDSFARQVYEAPRGEIEMALAAIWSELLHVEHISRHDNFFALGGHSLAVIALIERLRCIGLTVSLRTLFNNHTLGSLAKGLGQHHQLHIPPNSITPGSTTLTPAQLPLIDLSQADIDIIARQVPNGAQNIQDIYALSPLQEGILFHHILAMEGDPYLLISQMVFDDRELLDRYLNAVQNVINRHDIFRTSIFWGNVSEPAQVVWRHAPLNIHELTLSAANGPIAGQLMERFNPRKHRIDLSKAPLIHMAIAQDNDGCWVLTQLIHHLIGDHATQERMNMEIKAFVDNVAIDALPTPQPFRNLVAQARLGITQEEHKRYFTDMLKDISEGTLPFGLSDVYCDGTQITECHIMLPQELDVRLRSQAKILGVSLSSMFHLAWGRVLSSISGQIHVVFGTLLSGRVQAGEGSEHMMGLLINTLPFRIDLDNDSIRDSVRRTHEDLAALMEHEYASLALAQRCSSLPAGGPLFSSNLNYRRDTLPSGDYAEAPMAEFVGESERFNHPGIRFVGACERTNYPLSLAVEDFDVAMGLTAQVVQPLDPARICSYMLQALQGLAVALDSTPSMPVWQVEVVPKAERVLLLEEWNDTGVPFKEHLCIHQLFEQQVKRNPNATAVVYGDETLSYSVLNTRANGLAHRLIELGVKPDTRVAICVKRSPAMLVGILSILKAGGAYVPLDPAYPCERLAHILNDATPIILLADDAGRTALGDIDLTPLTVLDPNAQMPPSAANPDISDLASHHLVYVIYTSGSTGTPKGVMVEHRNVVNLIQHQTACYGIDSTSRTLQFASLSFDPSVSEIFKTLSCGACLYLPPDAVRLDRKLLWGYLEENAITHVTLAPPLLQDGKDLPALSTTLTLIMGGETPTTTLLQSLIPNVVVFLEYGPTEATINATTWRCPPDFNGEVVPIGRPVPNARVYVLDIHRQPVPLGAVGEIYIGGTGVTRGYLNLPGMTAERFIPDPFHEKEGARMYKTGDLARYLPDGALVFLGRNDHQVKIRGIRIEVGEIEARLIEHPRVREAVVITVGEGSDKRIVAYVVAEPDEHLAHKLRVYLKSKLPEYMVPAHYVCLDALPMLPSGKLDRRALPAIADEAVAREVYEAPQGGTEIALAGIWSMLLQIEHIGRRDNFFALGGHSLLAVRLMNRMVDLGASLPLTTIFSSPNLASLAATVDQHLNQKDTGARAITPVSRMGALEPSFAQESLWFVSQLNDRASMTYNIPLAIKFRGTLDGAAWQQALNTLFARHEALRSVFHIVDGKPKVELLDPEVGVPIIWHDLRGVPNAQVQLDSLTAVEMYEQFDLAHGPLLRARLVQLSDDEQVFLFTMYHMVSDGWSAGLLTQELNTLYAAYRAGQPNPLPPLFIQYPDYAAWQKQQLSGKRLDAQSSYWREALADTPALLELPTDRPRPPQQSFAGAVLEIHLDKQMTLALRRLSQEHGVTLFVMLLSAWGAVLSRLSGQDDILIGSINANRNHHQVEGLIGLFANFLVLRIDLSGEPSASQLLKRVQHCTLAAQDNQDLPFEEVVRIVNPPRKLSHTPLFQVTFTWQNNDMGAWDLPGLEVVPDLPSYNAASFDLELDLTEEEEEIVGELSFSTALFDHQTIERHISYLKAMLRAMIDDPERPVAKLDILSADERKLLLESQNETHMTCEKHTCVHQLFEQQVVRTPNATALVYEGQVWSYEDVNERANRLAHQLISLGVKPDMRIAICVERSPAMVVGLLAILKAGGAYVPLDPAYPSNRLVYILNDAAPVALIADGAGRSILSREVLGSLPTLDPNTQITLPSTNPSIPNLASNHLACVLYTTAPAGNPKGVMIEHRNLQNLVQGQLSHLEVNPSSRVLQLASLGADTSVLEIFMAIGYGASLYLPPNIVHVVRCTLWSYLATHDITHVALTPSFLQDGKDLPVLSSPLTLITRGEALNASSLRTVIPRGVFINLYGPTEASVGAIVWRCPPDFKGEVAPIGRPIANTRVYLLDKYGQPVPLGAVGEIYIGGAGVTRGYLNLPELTSERFVSDQFDADEDSGLFKTGDLARYLPDGNLELVGRDVPAVKIRGMRVEVAEVEACLVEHPKVREAAVTVLGEGNDRRLVAYIVAKSGNHLDCVLHTYLKTKLPEHMIPASIILLEALPLSPNGVLDNQALPVPDGRTSAHHMCEAPQGEIEMALAGIWSDLLHMQHISRHDSFFSLGGDSLLAVMMTSQIMTALNIEVTVHTVFESPTIARLTQRILEVTRTQDDPVNVLIPIKPTGSRPPLFCIHALVGHSWSVADLAAHLHQDQPVYYVEARLHSNVTSIDAAFDTMALGCVNEIRRVQKNGPYYLLGWSHGASIAHRIAVQLELQGESVALLALLDGYPDYSRSNKKSNLDYSYLSKPLVPKYPEPDYIIEKTTEVTCCSFFSCFSSENMAVTGQYFWGKYRNLLNKISSISKKPPTRIHKGSLLFIQATEGTDGSAPLFSPDLWKPYISGDLETHGIHCQQEDLIRPEFALEVAQVLRCTLDRLHQDEQV